MMPHWRYLENEYAPEQIFGLFLKGSQNYGLSTSESDIDTVALVIPTQRNLLLRSKCENYEITLPNNEIMVVKEIHSFVNELILQSPNALELLFTPYFISMAIYDEQFNILRSMAESIARYNPHNTQRAMFGMMKSNFLDYKKTNKEKKAYHTCRLAYMLEHYLNGDLYEQCLKPDFTRTSLPNIESTYEHAAELYNNSLSTKVPELAHIPKQLDNWLLSFYNFTEEK